MRRRDFIAVISGAAVAWPVAVRAQQAAPKIARIGWLGVGDAHYAYTKRMEALRIGLANLGHVEGKNLILEFRWAEKVDQLPARAIELVRMNVDVIFAVSSTEVEGARQATVKIPIVFATHADPVGVGHVASLARPSGNVTGLTMLLSELVSKELEILKEVVPHATRVGVLWNPTTPSHSPALKAVEAAGAKLNIQLMMVPARTEEDFNGAFSAMARERVDGFLAIPSPLALSSRTTLAELALKNRLPGMFGIKENAEAGGLISYSADLNDLVRRAATYIDKILKGAQPADLPVEEQASKYLLVINLKTAKALRITIPPMLLARADEVIE